MARKPNVPCAVCGKLLWGGRTCLPVGEHCCRGCRDWTRPLRICSIPTCERRHLAKGLCSMHYKREQPSTSALPTFLLDCLASLNGISPVKVKPIEIRLVGHGTLVRCPWCSSTMAFTSTAFRTCPMCATTVVLNPEELSWVISETLSTRQSKQAA